MCNGQGEREKEKENGNAELKSRAANEIKNVLAKVANFSCVYFFQDKTWLDQIRSLYMF